MTITLAADPSFQGLGRQMGKLVDQLHKGYSNYAPGEVWTPCVNLYETERSYLVCIDLAGVDKDKIEITVENQVLKLHGHRPVPSPEKAGPPPYRGRLRVHLMEIDHGSFSREVELPLDVHQGNIAAHYSSGMLWIELPKK